MTKSLVPSSYQRFEPRTRRLPPARPVLGGRKKRDAAPQTILHAHVPIGKCPIPLAGVVDDRRDARMDARQLRKRSGKAFHALPLHRYARTVFEREIIRRTIRLPPRDRLRLHRLGEREELRKVGIVHAFAREDDKPRPRDTDANRIRLPQFRARNDTPLNRLRVGPNRTDKQKRNAEAANENASHANISPTDGRRQRLMYSSIHGRTGITSHFLKRISFAQPPWS